MDQKVPGHGAVAALDENFTQRAICAAIADAWFRFPNYSKLMKAAADLSGGLLSIETGFLGDDGDVTFKVSYDAQWFYVCVLVGQMNRLELVGVARSRCRRSADGRLQAGMTETPLPPGWVPMSRLNTPSVLLPSLIDRLTDPDSGGTEAVRGYTIEQMTSAVRRDLEDLLNTRQTLDGIPEELVEVRRSVAAYGLPDVANLSALTEQQRSDIGQLLARIINNFEPRLCAVRVQLVDAGDETSRTVKFAVDARLRVDPSPEVAFDTLLELTTGHYSVQRRAGAT